MNDRIDSLRVRIDEIDEQLIALLGRRFVITNEVGQIKANGGIAAVDPDREDAQRKEYARLAASYGVGDTLVQAIFRSVIDEVVSNHRALREQ